MGTPEVSSAAPPELSVLVVGYRMAAQLANTLDSLGPAYQRGVEPHRYEVVVVENESDDMLDDALVAALPGNFTCLRRPNDSVSPVNALAEGLTHCRGEALGVIIDGAQMVTPGTLRFALMGFRYAADPVIVVPGYHLGRSMQHEVEDTATLLADQQRFLADVAWRQNGYRLFEWACFSPANRHGFLHPFMESNVFFCRRQTFIDIDGCDRRFQYPGGGAINLHLLRKLGLHADRPLIVLAGEGTFHQYHGGVTTSGRTEDHAGRVAQFRTQLQDIWQQGFRALRREPVLLGQVPEAVHPFLQASCAAAAQRARRLEESNSPLWEDDAMLGGTL